jgi:hypothetical protein
MTSKEAEFGTVESMGRASSWALSSCTIRFLLSPTPFLQKAIEPYLQVGLGFKKQESASV